MTDEMKTTETTAFAKSTKKFRKHKNKRFIGNRQDRLLFKCLFYLVGVCILFGFRALVDFNAKPNFMQEYTNIASPVSGVSRKLLAGGGGGGGGAANVTTNRCGVNITTNSTHGGGHELLMIPNVFTYDQLRGGYFVLQMFGMLYCFICLAILCDEFFEPALDAISSALGLSDDVAGATFMAMGSSAPEFFTSLSGSLMPHANDVGLGTIVGSAVFNVLIIIGLTALAAPNVKLTWYPLIRDCIFYCISIIALVIFVIDRTIYWYEGMIAILLYFCYILVMKFNRQIKKAVYNSVEREEKRKPMSCQLSLTRFVQSTVFNVFIFIVILFNLGIIVAEFVDVNNQITWITDVNLACSAIFMAEMVLKISAFGFYSYWKDPSNALDGVLVGLILFELVLRGINNLDSGSTSSGARGLRMFRIMRVTRSLRCLRLVQPGKKAIATVLPVGPSHMIPSHQLSVNEVGEEDSGTVEVAVIEGLDTNQDTAGTPDPSKSKGKAEKKKEKKEAISLELMSGSAPDSVSAGGDGKEGGGRDSIS